MPSFITSATSILEVAERRLEATAQNVANSSTTGYKRQVSFSESVDYLEGLEGNNRTESQVSDLSQGRLIETGNFLDLAISGPALFLLRDGDEYVFSRGGSFTLGSNGVLEDASGRVLQLSGGGDASLSGDDAEILDDGTVLDNGLPVARLALFEAEQAAALTPLGGSGYAAPETAMRDAESSVVRQGFLENSNVVMSDEMVSMMAAVRQAESGGRLVQFYNQLIGQAVTTFSRSGQ